MTAVGLLTLELQIQHAQSLKDKRQVIRSLKDRIRSRFNAAVAEVDHQDSWQRSTIAVATVSGDRQYAEEALRKIEEEAARAVGVDLVSAEVEFL
jgi:uncharacterized protein YlxP (DUF503 family)